jgi:hypothetical protein
LLQVHYTNPKAISGTKDRSGFRLFYTPKLKQFDLGVMALGKVGFNIPAQQPSYSIGESLCSGRAGVCALARKQQPLLARRSLT